MQQQIDHFIGTRPSPTCTLCISMVLRKGIVILSANAQLTFHFFQCTVIQEHFPQLLQQLVPIFMNFEVFTISHTTWRFQSPLVFSLNASYFQLLKCKNQPSVCFCTVCQSSFLFFQVQLFSTFSVVHTVYETGKRNFTMTGFLCFAVVQAFS